MCIVVRSSCTSEAAANSALYTANLVDDLFLQLKTKGILVIMQSSGRCPQLFKLWFAETAIAAAASAAWISDGVARNGIWNRWTKSLDYN